MTRCYKNIYNIISKNLASFIIIRTDLHRPSSLLDRCWLIKQGKSLLLLINCSVSKAALTRLDSLHLSFKLTLADNAAPPVSQSNSDALVEHLVQTVVLGEVRLRVMAIGASSILRTATISSSVIVCLPISLKKTKFVLELHRDILRDFLLWRILKLCNWHSILWNLDYIRIIAITKQVLIKKLLFSCRQIATRFEFIAYTSLMLLPLCR